jgi:hypothetical protein
MSLLPVPFLVRIAHPCRYVAALPSEDADQLLDLPPGCRIDHFPAMDGRKQFADVRLAWNEGGLGVQVEVRGKDQPLLGDAAKPRASDGLTLWLDTRDARAAHRASRYCHMFHFLAAGGGAEQDEPLVVQAPIHRALEDAPLCQTGDVPFRRHLVQSGYRLEAFLTAAVLQGFDPEQNARLGFYFAVRDAEHGEQVLSVGPEFPFWEDPSLWSVLRLER